MALGIEWNGQADFKWKDVKVTNTNSTIGQIGCLLATLSNLYNLHEGKIVTSPTMLNRNLNFTKDGSVIWSSVEKEFGCKVIFDNKNPKNGDYNIARYNLLGNSHFSPILGIYNDTYAIWDVWDCKLKFLDQSKITRVTTLIFPEEGECECCKLKL